MGIDLSKISKHHKNSSQDDIQSFISKSPKEIVSEKLRALGYDEKMSKDDFDLLSAILSDKDKLLKSYMHKEFDKAKELDNRVDKMIVQPGKDSEKDLGKDEKRLEQGSKSIQLGGIIGFASSSHDNSDDVIQNLAKSNQDQSQELMAQTIVKSIYQEQEKKLRIKLIVSETAQNVVEKNAKRFVSPFINMAWDHPPQFGLFHIALGIGPWKIEWNSSSLCIPRTITGKSCLICADIESIATSQQLDVVREKVAEIIVKWNTQYYYRQSPGKSSESDPKKTGNCQQFIDEIMQELGLQNGVVNNFPPPLQNYIKKLRKHGMAQMQFKMSPEFRQQFKQTQKKIIFHSHRQLDQWMLQLQQIEPDFHLKYKYEWYLLKSFDRAFWMRHLKDKSQIKCQPLQDDQGALLCPFGDACQTSILHFNVKR